jgi:hypothetical protein
MLERNVTQAILRVHLKAASIVCTLQYYTAVNGCDHSTYHYAVVSKALREAGLFENE